MAILTKPTLPATLLADGQRYMVEPQGLSIGRESDNQVVVASDRASRHHARVHQQGEGWVVADLGSRNGTQLNGHRFRDDSRELRDGDSITVAGLTLRFLTDSGATHMGTDKASRGGVGAVRISSGTVSIGRHTSNQVVLEDPNISRFHAEITSRDGQAQLRDLGSRNGTRLNGQPVQQAALQTGDEVGIGPFRLLFDGSQVVARDERGALRLDASQVAVDVAGKRILHPTSVSVPPSQFVAIIGESGSGKSTLIKALAGINHPSQGQVTVSGEPVAARLTDIGYVPQDEIVHAGLTVREALHYAARLRLPDDATAKELQATVDRVLEELGLGEHADTRIGDLSGGQRKRAGVAVELLSQPSLLLLDEPTTGLDPGLETRTMKLLRDLANRSRAVVTVTHSTKNLGLCDQLVVMGRGGYLCYSGSPGGALEFFKSPSFDEVYSKLEQSSAEEWSQRFLAQFAEATAGMPSANGAVARPGVKVARPRKLSLTHELATLTGRYARLMVRDRRNLAILLGQVPIIAAAILGLFHQGLFALAGGNPRQAAQLLFLITTTAIWLGSIDAAREIVKERAVFERERAIGVRLSSYLGSKALVLFALSAVQCLLLTGLVLVVQPLHQPASAYLLVVGLSMLTAWVAVGMGLVLSAGVRTQDQATSFIPLALIPQLLFAGAIVPVKLMSSVVAGLSWMIFARWSFAGLGSAAHVQPRLSALHGPLNPYGRHFFDLPVAAAALALMAFILLFFLVAAAMLRRSEGRRSI